MTSGYSDGVAHLQGALTCLDLRLRREVMRWRASHRRAAPPEELLGLYVSDDAVDTIFDGLGGDGEPLADASALIAQAEADHRAREHAADLVLPLPELCATFALNAFERDVVLLALAPEVDRRYERLFAYLNDDGTARWPTAGLALRLFGGDLGERAAARASFAPGAPLRFLELLHLREDPGGAATLPAQQLQLDVALVDRLLGSAESDRTLGGSLRPWQDAALAPLEPHTEDELRALERLVASAAHPPPIAVTGPDMVLTGRVAARLARAWRAGAPMLVLEAADLDPVLCARAAREAILEGAALAVRGPLPRFAREVLQAAPLPGPLFLLAEAVEEPADIVHVRVPAAGVAQRALLWRDVLNGAVPEIDPHELAGRFRLDAAQIDAAAAEARVRSAIRGSDGRVATADVVASCRNQASAPLAALAERIHSIHGWDALILPPDVKNALLGLEHWVRHRDTVYRRWGFERRVLLGRGLTTLFTGPPGTGKTMAAGVLARALELELYRVDLSIVVSKYIGETEKNLARIFAAAEGAGAILFFDEADALFGKRSEVRDAHDRYANIEVSYLLQRMEAHDGIAILATNLRENLDRAFSRRVHVAIEFPLPQTADRERIWRQLLDADVPLSDEVDLGYLARRFPLSGGSIRNCALAAAFTAAAGQRAVAMGDLVLAVARELTKIGQPVVPSDFAPYETALRGPRPVAS